MLLMHVIEGSDRGKRFELPLHEPQLIGRSTEALPFTDDTISRRHAELTPDDGAWFIDDLHSSHGTFINGRPVLDRTEVMPGDRIRCGNMVAVLEHVGETRDEGGIVLLGIDAVDATVLATITTGSESLIGEAPDALEAATTHLRILYELIALTGPSYERGELLSKVMELIAREFRPASGAILLGDEVERMNPYALRTPATRPGAPTPAVQVSRDILAGVLESQEGVLASVAFPDSLRGSESSAGAYTLRSVLCVPIRTGTRLFGAIHIDSDRPDLTYTEAQLQLLSVFGQHTGLALLNADLLTSKVHHERLATVGETVASLSHSIKNILQGLRGGADAVELALNRDNLDMAREGWPILNRNLDRILALTLNMLAYSKPQTLEIDLINLNQIIEDVADLMNPQCVRKRSKLSMELDEHMPPIPADGAAIHQALMNLMFNAVEAIPAKRGEITIRSHYHAEAGEAEIVIGDNGPGIDPALRDEIFEAFTTTKGQRGTGLGLAVTRKIIDDHGGRIRLQSHLGQGTTFTITLDTERDEGAADETRAPRPLPHVEIHEEL